MKEIPKKIKKKLTDKRKNRLNDNSCYLTVVKILMLLLLVTGLTGCKSREAQILIDEFQEARAQVDAEEAGKELSGSDSDKTNVDSDTAQRDKELEADEETFSTGEKESDRTNRNKSVKDDIISDEDSSDENTKAKKVSATENQTQMEMIFVDVCGAVVNPGVFQLEAGSRVFQAIEAAGGYLPEAAQTCINRAGVLVDGQQLYILTQEEMEQQGINPAEMANASGNTGNLPGTQAKGNADAVQGSIDTAQLEVSSDVSEQQDNRVNINTADETQLTTLTGIGTTRAQAIIAYREENGPFAAIEEIMNVQGIKEGTFAKIKDEIVVE